MIGLVALALASLPPELPPEPTAADLDRFPSLEVCAGAVTLNRGRRRHLELRWQLESWRHERIADEIDDLDRRLVPWARLLTARVQERLYRRGFDPDDAADRDVAGLLEAAGEGGAGCGGPVEAGQDWYRDSAVYWLGLVAAELAPGDWAAGRLPEPVDRGGAIPRDGCCRGNEGEARRRLAVARPRPSYRDGPVRQPPGCGVMCRRL